MNREWLRLAFAGVFLFILPFTHTVALRLLALFTAAALAAWQWAREREPPLAELPAWRWILFWTLLPVALAAFSHDLRYSLGEMKTEIVYGMLALFVFFFGIRNERALRAALLVLFAAFVVMTLGALGSRVYLGYWENERYFGGAGTFSVYLVTIMPMLVLARQVRLFGESTSGLVVLLAVLGFATGVLTEQRGLWAALAAQGIALLILLRAARLWRPRPAWFWGAIAAVIVIAVFVLLEVASLRFGADSGARMRADPRLQNWLQVLAWIGERPLTGFGFGRGMMAKAFPEMWGRVDLFWHPHNVVLNYGFELGIAGIVAILGLFGGLLVHWSRLARSEDALLRAVGIAGALLVVGVFMRNMTNDLFQRDLSLLFWALTGMLAGYAASHARNAAITRR